MFVLGLIGRTGSGKSTAARALERDGAVVVDADALGHEVTDHDPEVRLGLASEYGSDVYLPDGRLDRARVAARVFTDPAALARLDRLVHPRIVARIRSRLEELRAAGFDGVVILDAALLLDWGLERWCDAVIAVVAPESEQIARLEAARGWTESQARRRLSVQRSPDALRSVADETLENRGSPEELEALAREACLRLRRRHATTGREAC